MNKVGKIGFLFFIILFGCKTDSSINNKNNTDRADSSVTEFKNKSREQIEYEASFDGKCFKVSDGYENNTNLIINITDSGNFFKMENIDELSYKWSCGRAGFEYVIDTLICGVLPRKTSLAWETSEYICLQNNCGSNCFIETIIPLNGDDVIYLDYVSIDLLKLNVITLDNDGYFIVESLVNGKTKKVSNLYTKLDLMGSPYLVFRNVSIIDSIISYEVKNGANYLIDTLSWKW